MHKEPNRLLRIVVPVILLIAGIGIAMAVLKNSGSSGNPGGGATTPSASPPPTTPTTPTTAATPPTPPSTTPSPTTPAPSTPQAGAAGEQAAAQPVPAGAAEQPAMSAAPDRPATAVRYAAKSVEFTGYDPIGSLTAREQGGKDEMELRFSAMGTGLESLRLSNHFTTIEKTEHESLQVRRLVPGAADDRFGLFAFAMNKIEVDGVAVELGMAPTKGSTLWRQVAPGEFECIIGAGDSAEPALRLTRRFELRPGAYEFAIHQRVENLTGRPVKVRWFQYGPMDLPVSKASYGGDVRRVRFGYLLPANLDPAQIVQGGDRFLTSHNDALGSPTGVLANGAPAWAPKALWPNADSTKNQLTLSWAATTSRYFAVAIHPMDGARALPIGAVVDRFAVATDAEVYDEGRGPRGWVGMRLNGPEQTVQPGKPLDLSVTAYAGPMSKRYIENQPAAAAVSLQELVVYTFGGPCGFCTFQPIAGLLHWGLGVLHDYVTRDWALAVMLLVVCVRTTLHPVTRWSQSSLTRFGKQMSKLGPKQKAIQEKYKDDPVKMREEIKRLMQEENVNYAGALGCLPMFFAMPIWIALYAMIFFSFELLHVPAFFGVIQSLTGGRWTFLGDLSQPDNFINFHHAFGWNPDGIWIPALSRMVGRITGLNILPLILGVVFFIQQKYMTPPTTTQLTPEQEQQQKIMKVMTVVLFPLFMYNAPAALSLYFMVNSTLGIFESKWIRAHVERVDAERAKLAEARAASGLPARPWGKKNAAPQKEGFLAKMRRLAEERQKMMDEAKRMQQKRKK